MRRAAARGLRVVERDLREPGIRGLLAALAHADDADVISLRTPIDA
jgi:hypothetical protein